MTKISHKRNEFADLLLEFLNRFGIVVFLGGFIFVILGVFVLFDVS
jgi:hypothetical protein